MIGLECRLRARLGASAHDVRESRDYSVALVQMTGWILSSKFGML